MKLHSIWFEEKERAALRCEDLSGDLSGRQVLVKADYSLISAGTELANYHALPNTSIEGYPCTYPRSVGYSGSGHVIAVGPEAQTLKVGDRVAVVWSGHKSYFKQDEDFNLYKRLSCYLETYFDYQVILNIKKKFFLGCLRRQVEAE